MSVKEGHNVRISPRAWELLRWAKLEKDSKSYSDLIIDLNKKKPNDKSIKKFMDDFDGMLHAGFSSKDKKGSKTVLLTNDARKVLETIKVMTSEPTFTFSDAIEYLVLNNKIDLPEKLKRV